MQHRIALRVDLDRVTTGAGVNPPGHGIAADTKTVEASPELVKAFVSPSPKGFQDAQRDPTAAIEPLRHSHPEAARDHTQTRVEVLKNFMPLLHSARTEGHPIGWMSKDGWAGARQILLRVASLANELPAGSHFTNQFVPES